MQREERTAKIRQLNDDLRTGRNQRNGKVVLMGSLAQEHLSDPHKIANVARHMMQFDAFENGDDPYREHDFGAFEVDDERFIFKIDYYALDEETLSEHPEDLNVTMRILSLFYAEDY